MAKRIVDRDRMESLRNELGFKDPGIFEKSVYAFNLLSEVVKCYPGLVFKGGTSLLLHIFPPARLSIDIDILLPPSEKEGLSERLTQMAADSDWFEGIEESHRKNKTIPKAHFKFPITSHFSKIQQYVLLDVVFTEAPYGSLLQKDIATNPMAFAGARGVVNVPTVEGLLGDKLTAISPKTMGIPLVPDRTMEFMKQIIDLGELFKVADDDEELRRSFVKTVMVENGFRNSAHSSDDVFDDITEIAFRYSQALLRGGNTAFEEIGLLNDGNARVANHLRARLSPDRIKISFARIAYVISILRQGKAGKMVKQVDMSMVKDRVFPEKYKILEKLRAALPEAYFYWALAVVKNETKNILL